MIETVPLVECPLLPRFEPSGIDACKRAFARSSAVPLRQAWRETPETGFRPASVHLARRPEALMLFADIADEDIVSGATGFNQRMWELGDVLEIFLQPPDQEAYFEFHITPNNHRLQLFFKKQGDQGTLLEEEYIRSSTWVLHEAKRWFVFAEFPAATFGSGPLVTGAEWRFSVSRYDYARGSGQPVLSSTSPHTEVDFHRLHEWGILRLI